MKIVTLLLFLSTCNSSVTDNQRLCLFSHAFFPPCPSLAGSLQAELADWRSHEQTEKLTSCSDRSAVRPTTSSTHLTQRNSSVSAAFLSRSSFDTSDTNTDGTPQTVLQKFQRAPLTLEHAGRTNKQWAVCRAEATQRLIPEYIYFPFVAARHPCRQLTWHRFCPTQYKAAVRNKSKAFSDKTLGCDVRLRLFVFYLIFWIFTSLKLQTREKWKFECELRVTLD